MEKVVIFAGGFGTRLDIESTVKIPKPMTTIGQAPILWHIMKYYSSYSFKDFIILAGFAQSAIKEYFFNYYKRNSDITVDLKTDTITYHKKHNEDWSVTILDTGLDTCTGGRLLKAKEYLNNERFFATYGDGLANVNLHKLMEFHDKSDSIVTLTSVQSSGRFGSLEIEDSGKIASFKEKPVNDSWINAGFMVCEPEIFNYLGEGDFANTLEKLSEMGLSSAYKHNGFFQAMDYIKDRNTLELMWKENKAPWKIW